MNDSLPLPTATDAAALTAKLQDLMATMNPAEQILFRVAITQVVQEQDLHADVRGYLFGTLLNMTPLDEFARGAAGAINGAYHGVFGGGPAHTVPLPPNVHDHRTH